MHVAIATLRMSLSTATGHLIRAVVIPVVNCWRALLSRHWLTFVVVLRRPRYFLLRCKVVELAGCIVEELQESY